VSKNKSKKKCKVRGKIEQNRPARENNESSLPSGKDESRLITVVRERWNAYQAQEKRFSRAFALALIALHKQLAKPGYGSFVEKLRELKIPTSTAYRLMRLQGWQPEKRIAKEQTKGRSSREQEEFLLAMFKNKALTEAGKYLDQFEAGKPFRAKFAGYWRELRSKFWQKIAPVGAKKPVATATLELEPEAMEAAI
jgi:hypothetical protein